MLRGSRTAKGFPAAPLGGHARLRCLGCVPLRTATMLLALLGFVGHLQMAHNLVALHDSFPRVPRVRHAHSRLPSASTPSLLSSLVTVSASAFQSAEPLRPTLFYDGVTKPTDFDTHPLGTSDIDLGSQGATPSDLTEPTATLSSEEELANIKPAMWFNLLPKRPPWDDGDRMATAEEIAAWRAQQADQEEQRSIWDTARTLTQAMRLYALVSAAACALGVYGVARSNLTSTRIFVISSFCDLLLFAFSLVSVCIISTYPDVRLILCEQMTSGELHAFFNEGSHADIVGRGKDAALSQASAIASAHTSATSPSASDPLPAARLLSYATGSLWRRALASAPARGPSTAMMHMSWWDAWIDEMLENESCDDVFTSFILPVGLLICVAYLALRIHFLLVIRGYYTSLIRERSSFYLGGKAVSSSTCKGSDADSVESDKMAAVRGDAPLLSLHREGDNDEEKKKRSNSSSSSSSSTVVDFYLTRKQKGRMWAAEKAWQENKMA